MRLFLPAIGPPPAVWLKSTVGTILQIFSPQLLQSPHTFGTISSRNVHSAAGGAITDTARTVAEPAHAADRRRQDWRRRPIRKPSSPSSPASNRRSAPPAEPPSQLLPT